MEQTPGNQQAVFGETTPSIKERLEVLAQLLLEILIEEGPDLS